MKIKLCKLITCIFFLTAIIVPTVSGFSKGTPDNKSFAIQNPSEVL